jgi:hypothetical protein
MISVLTDVAPYPSQANNGCDARRSSSANLESWRPEQPAPDRLDAARTELEDEVEQRQSTRSPELRGQGIAVPYSLRSRPRSCVGST